MEKIAEKCLGDSRSVATTRGKRKSKMTEQALEYIYDRKQGVKCDKPRM